MKKYLLMFSIISSFCFSQKNDAKFYFKNGSIKTGKADIVLNGESKVKFRDSETDKSEKIKFDDLIKVEYFDKDRESSVIFEWKEITWKKKKKETVWVNKIESGEISVYISKTYVEGYTNMATANTMPSETLTCYFFQYKDQMPETLYYLINKKPVKNKKEILGYVESFFNKTCPNLVQQYDSGKIILKNDPFPLLEFYKQNCNK